MTMGFDFKDDNVETGALSASARLFGAQSANAAEPSSYSRDAIGNYVVTLLAAAAFGGITIATASGIAGSEHVLIQQDNVLKRLPAGILLGESASGTTQAANTFLGGPTAGGATAPVFRTLVAADLPAHTHDWATITGTPTTLAGYGITDAQPLSANLTTWAGITPGTGVGPALAVNVGSSGALWSMAARSEPQVQVRWQTARDSHWARGSRATWHSRTSPRSPVSPSSASLATPLPTLRQSRPEPTTRFCDARARLWRSDPWL
jgi:hypothetical protein